MNRRDRVVKLLKAGQTKIITDLEDLDSKGKFQEYSWQRPGGGGGTAQVMEGGKVFERAGVNVSAVHGVQVPPSLAQKHPGAADKPFFATGISMVLHPCNPYVPAFHANYRYFEVGASDIWWFGGGADMTPSYGFAEDAVYFHKTLKDFCDRHNLSYYPKFKVNCDDYFFIKHRQEMRGIGGIFFDQLQDVGTGDWEANFKFIRDGIDTILPSYLPIVKRRQDMAYGERERQWQLYRRGRYVEFNLVYDRGTTFGLQTSGNIEAILMSMPPLARWEFNAQPELNSPEAKLAEYLKPRNWAEFELEEKLAG